MFDRVDEKTGGSTPETRPDTDAAPNGSVSVRHPLYGARSRASRSRVQASVAPGLTSEILSRRLLGLADAAALIIALVVSTVLVGSHALQATALASPLVFILIAKAIGLYDRDAELLHKTTLDEVPSLLGLSTAATLLVWLSNGAIIAGDLSRFEVVTLWGVLFAGVIILRSAARATALSMSSVQRCLFVGDSESADELREKLALSHSVRAELVGWLPSDGEPDTELSLSEQIRSLAVERDIQRIILGPGASHDELLDAVRQIKENGVRVSVMPNVARLVNASIEFDRLEGMTLLGVRRFEMTFSSRLIKRTFDVAGSLVGLTLLSPLLLTTALAVKLDSRGPVLFRQRRAGRDSQTFEVVKFRSMHIDAEAKKEGLRHLNEADGVFKIANDPRITRVGRVMRRAHVDELPQLLNVLLGEMSLVGPRPLPLDEDRRIEGWHRRRLDLRPGITGLWQILGSSRIPVHEMVKLDYQYVADWSLWNDVRILLRTLAHVARRRGQ